MILTIRGISLAFWEKRDYFCKYRERARSLGFGISLLGLMHSIEGGVWGVVVKGRGEG
jgi:hypothetical protein